MSSPQTIVVVGGGIIGVCAAYYLARRGAAVTLLEQGTFDGSASTGNAGLISLGHPPLPRPGLTAKAFKWMFDPASPLYIPPRLDGSLLRWLWAFRRAGRADHFERNTRILCEHGWPAGECFRQLVEEESIDCEYRPVGQFDVFRTEAGLRAGEAEADTLRGHGYRIDALRGDELRAREPAFRGDVVGATLYRDRAFANPRSFVLEVAERARRHGADLREGTPIADLLVDGGRCVGVVTDAGERIEGARTLMAAGIWSSALARRAGVRIPMQPGKGYHVFIDAPQPSLETASVFTESFVAATPIDGALQLAGTLEFSGINDRIVAKRIAMLLTGARRYLDGVNGAQPRGEWCGLRPCAADGLPIVGWAPTVESLFIATGHAMMGFTLGPLTGRLAAECLLGETPALDLAPLSPARFG